MSLTKQMIIDVVSDVVCPWCYLGKHRLEAALAVRPDIDAEIHWKPYFLDPRVPREGMARVDYLSRKFGSDERIRPAHERLSKLGKEEGVEFHFEKIARQPNTLDAHRLIAWAEGKGKASSLVERIFALFFTEGADLTDTEVLVKAAAASGLNEDKVRQDLASERDIMAIQDAANSADMIAAAMDQALAADRAA